MGKELYINITKCADTFNDVSKEADVLVKQLIDALPANANPEDYKTLKKLLRLRLDIQKMIQAHLLMENMVLKNLLGESEGGNGEESES